MSNNDNMIRLVRLFEGNQFAGEPEQKPGDQVRGTDKAEAKGKQHPFHNRLVGEEISMEDKLSKRYQDMKDVQAREKEQKEKEESDKQDVAEGGYPDVDHMPGPTIKRTQTGCKRCHGKGYVYKTPDGEVYPMNRPDAKKYKCGKCDGIGFVKVSEQGVAEDAVADFMARGGQVQQGKFHKPRKSERTDYGSRHIGGVRDAVAGKAGKTLGRAAATNFKGGGKAVVGEEFGGEDSPVSQAIARRILMQRTDLLSKYGPVKVMSAIDEVADFVGDVDEIGSSDVSGWIRHVEQMLGNMEEGVEEAAPSLVKGAAGLALGGLAAAGAPAIVGILGPLLGIPLAAYGAYSATKLGMKGVEKLWDMAAQKLGGEDQVAQYTNAKIAKLPPDQAQAAAQVVKSVAESRRAQGGTELAEVANPTDKITVDVPLMIRIMEYAREDAQNDVDLHNVAEQLVRLSSMGKTLGMADYDGIVGVTTEQKLSELGAVPPAPPQGTATANTAPTSGSVSPNEQTALNKIQTNPAMKQQFDKLMTQATPGAANKPMALDPAQTDALEKIKTNAGLKGQYDRLIKQANPGAAP